MNPGHSGSARPPPDACAPSPLSEASYLTLHLGADDLIAVIHHFDHRPVELTAHALTSVDRPLWRIIVAEGGPVFEGDTSAWENLPRAYTAYYRSRAGWSDYVLLLVDPRRRTVELQRFDWFDDSYNKDFQGIVGVTEVPGSDRVIVAVQRDSTPVLYDPAQRRMVRKIPLAGRGGNADLRFRKTGQLLVGS